MPQVRGGRAEPRAPFRAPFCCQPCVTAFPGPASQGSSGCRCSPWGGHARTQRKGSAARPALSPHSPLRAGPPSSLPARLLWRGGAEAPRPPVPRTAHAPFRGHSPLPPPASRGRPPLPRAAGSIRIAAAAAPLLCPAPHAPARTGTCAPRWVTSIPPPAVRRGEKGEGRGKIKKVSYTGGVLQIVSPPKTYYCGGPQGRGEINCSALGRK